MSLVRYLFPYRVKPGMRFTLRDVEKPKSPWPVRVPSVVVREVRDGWVRYGYDDMPDRSETVRWFSSLFRPAS